MQLTAVLSHYTLEWFLTWQGKWKSLSHVWLFVTPWTIQCMEFSRPEYWSGLPFPSPGDLPYPGTEPRSPALQADSLPAEPPGKTKNIGVGSLSLLQGIFPTQESNQGLLHCRQSLYQLSYQGSQCPGVCSDSCLLSQWCCLTISSSAVTFSFCLQSFPASGSCLLSQLFASGGQSIGASASTISSS